MSHRWRSLALCLLAIFVHGSTDVARAQGRFFRRTIVVNPIPGDPVRSGDRLMTALSRVSGATALRPWLIRVEAGIYDVEETTVVMVPFADIEGSGQGVTKITGSALGAAVVQGASDSELRNLTVEHRGDTAGGWAIGSDDKGFALHRVTALSSGGALYGVRSRGDSAVATDVTVRVSGATGGRGLQISGSLGSWKGIDVSIVGTGILYALFNSGSDNEFSEIVAEAESADAFAGAIRNEGVVASPTMRNVRAHAKGAIGQAITNGNGSSARLYDVVATAVGTSSFAVGISNQFGSPLLKNVDVRAESPGSGYAVSNLLGSTVTMYAVTAVGTGGTQSAGLVTDGSTSYAHDSNFKGDAFSVDNRFDASTASFLGASRLDGPVNAGAGVLKCVASYDGAFNSLSAGCTP